MWFEFRPLAAQMIKNLPAMQETQVRSLGWEDALEKGKAAQSSVLARRIPWSVCSSRGRRVGHNWATNTHTELYAFVKTHELYTT